VTGDTCTDRLLRLTGRRRRRAVARAYHGVNVHDETEEQPDVLQRGQRRDERHEQRAQPLRALDHAQQPRDAQDAQRAQQVWVDWRLN
jgi:hypothetical protein